MNQSPETKPQKSDNETMMNVVMLIIQLYATAAEVALHRWMGERYLGFNGLGVVLLIPAHAYFHRGQDVSLLLDWILIHILLCITQKIGTRGRKRQGKIPHTRFNGTPWYLSENTHIDEVFFKMWAEPFLVILAGGILLTVNRPFASFVVMSGFALYLKGAMVGKLHRARLLDMRDGVIEQQVRAEQFREMSGTASNVVSGHVIGKPGKSR